MLRKTICHLSLLLLLIAQPCTTAFSIRPKNNDRAARRSKALGREDGRMFQLAAIAIDQDSIASQEQEVEQTMKKEKQSPTASIKTLYQSYLRAIEERPIITKGLTAAVVNLLGDILAQFLEASTAGVAFVPNWVRLQGFFLCGLIYTGPYVHSWYEQLWKLGRWMETKYNSSKRVRTMAQLLVDQTFGILFFFSTYFYVYEIIDALVSHRLPIMSAATAKITDNLGSVLLTNYYFWPLANWISFTFVPVQLRVLLNNVVGVLWNAFLCTKMAAA